MLDTVITREDSSYSLVLCFRAEGGFVHSQEGNFCLIPLRCSRAVVLIFACLLGVLFIMAFLQPFKKREEINWTEKLIQDYFVCIKSTRIT